MRAVIQRVSESRLRIENNIHSEIGLGLVVLVGFEAEDELSDLEWMANKLIHLRIFPDEEGVMNKSVLDVGAELLIVSQFTLHASTKKGNRPSYIKAAKPEIAIPLYEKFIEICSKDCSCSTGVFGADMKIELINDGPVTICIDSKSRE